MLRDKFEWDGYSLQDVRQKILKIANRVEPDGTVNASKDDPDDNRILECAIKAGSDSIVTEDKDLLRLKEFQGIRIIRAADFLQQLLEP